ncbi:hypothetical protein [Deinococcus aquaedulcis]|nr:hypothetical protein [Deinococcus aquaedulcis]
MKRLRTLLFVTAAATFTTAGALGLATPDWWGSCDFSGGRPICHAN